jgi:hypothetical protein
MDTPMYESDNTANFDELDDVDRMFGRLDLAPVPDDLIARVLASTVASGKPRSVLAWPWMAAELAALAVLVVAGYELGVSLASSDGLELFAAIFGDLGLLATAPGDVLAALSEVVPWTLVATATLSTALVVLAAGNVFARDGRTLTARHVA